MTDITYPTLTPTHFDYDGDGRRIDMTDATGKTIWDYTYAGVHCTAQATPQGTVYFGFDADGRRTALTLVNTGVWNYSYFNAGNLKTVESPTDGTTSFLYDPADRLTQKTKGSGQYETYAYDTCDELKSIGYYWADTTLQNSLVYGYDLAGNVQTVNQGYYATTYGYDGADQLTSETSTGSYPPPAVGYTYDSNGNRKTQTSNGQPFQSFTYDAHDKLTSGTAGNETDGYDLNGSETSTTISGGTYHETYDDEDRMTSLTLPGGITDTFTYNGLGLRVGKTDSTGTYTYVCDGASPGSDVLSDGHALYTPGLSENRGGTSSYYSSDLLGNLWTVEGSGKSQTGYEDTTGFGTLTALAGIGGAGGTPFGYGGGNGCQTDADTGLILMGHRYYDTRIGRFISQDPAGDGDNWYAYAGNSPTNETDPFGLAPKQLADDPFDNGATAPPPDSTWIDSATGERVTTDANGVYLVNTGTSHVYIIHESAGDGGTTDADMGFAGAVDGFVTGGMVAAAGRDWDAHPTQARFEAAGAAVIVVGTAISLGRGGVGALAKSGCFAAGTPVQEDGKSKPIETISAGEMVATRNLQTNQTEYRKVVRTFKHLAYETVTVEFADAKTGKVVDTLTGTPEHPFYVAGQGMKALGKLGIGTLVVTRAGPPVVVKSLVRHHSAAGVAVYNLEVEGDHTYFVGNTGEWVHNDCRTVGELIMDFKANPLNWQSVKTELLPSINRLNKGGTSLQELFHNTETKEELVRHTLFGPDGSIFEESHFRGYWK